MIEKCVNRRMEGGEKNLLMTFYKVNERKWNVSYKENINDRKVC